MAIVSRFLTAGQLGSTLSTWRIRFDPSLRVRVVALVTASLLCAVGLGGTVLWHLRVDAEQGAMKEAASIARTLADQLVYRNNRQAITSLNTRTGRMQSLVDFVHERERRDLEVVGVDGTIVADSDHSDVGTRLRGEAGDVVAAILADGRSRAYVEGVPGLSDNVHQIAVAMTDSSGPVGVLVYDYTELRSETLAQSTAATWQFALVALPLALMFVAITLRSMRPILRTLESMAEAARAIGRGDHSGRMHLTRTDELGELGRAFDLMASQLETSNTRLLQENEERRTTEELLQQANEGLEQRVSDRTASLQHLNERLHAELVERARVEEQLARLARFDTLTGLPNRAALMQHLEQALAGLSTTYRRVAMMFVDIDRFKSINDSFGHEVGDTLLQQVAARVQSISQGFGAVYRHAGDEFSIVAEETGERVDFDAFAARLVESFQHPLTLAGGQEIHVTLSVGLAVAPDDARDVADLIRRADFAMYYAKAEGRNCYRAHSSRMSEEAGARLTIEYALRDAQALGEFSLHYQPRVSAEDGRLVGMEALLRWNSATLGRVPPDTFIPIAEEAGLIGEIGEWVIRSSFEQMAAWRKEGLQPGVVAINVSAGQLRVKDFPDRVLAAAHAAGVLPAEVELELTESMLVADPESAATMLGSLRAHGFGIAIDDFGKGHSSLMHLKRFPITKLKIDRAFVTDIAVNQEDVAIAASIIALGNALDVRVTAEGVETQDQLDVLAGLRCDEYQGYLFGRPVDATAMGEALKQLRPSCSNDDRVPSASARIQAAETRALAPLVLACSSVRH